MDALSPSLAPPRRCAIALISPSANPRAPASNTLLY